MSEVDVSGQVLSTFTDVTFFPLHLSTDSEGHLFVPDSRNHRILLLNSQLRLERVLLERNSQVKLWYPTRLSYNELTSQLHVVHSDRGGFISCWSVRWLRDWWLLYTQTHSTLLTHLILISFTHFYTLQLLPTLLVYTYVVDELIAIKQINAKNYFYSNFRF